MAGEPSLYLVYKDFSTDERTRVSWHGTQASRQTPRRSTAGLIFAAHQGAVTMPRRTARPARIYNPTADTWRTVDVSDLDELGQRKAAATALYAGLDEPRVFDLDKRSLRR